MQTPPPFQMPSGPPPRKSNPWKTVLIVFGVLGVCCVLPVAGLGIAGFFGFNALMKNTQCFISAGMLGEALTEYQKAHKGTLPPADKWQEALKPYIAKAVPSDKVPFETLKPEGEWSCASEKQVSGFAFNKDFSGKKVADIKEPAKAVIIFETTSVAKNQNSSYKPLPYTESPNIFGESHRGWIIINAEGEMEITDKNGVPSKANRAKFGRGMKISTSSSKSENDSEQ